MKTLRTLGVTVVLGTLGAVLSLNCGGKSEAEAPPACPAALTGACSSGETCSQAYTDCHGAGSYACSCASGQWACPQIGPTDCPPQPWCLASEGQSCTTTGQVCSSGADCAQGSGPIHGGDCTCDGKSFHCTAIECPQPPMCPPPSAVHEGGSCTGSMMSCTSSDPILDCNGQVVGTQSCFCSGGRWNCPAGPPPCAVDAGGGPG